VPLNWSAYEDIAEFFTNDVKTIDGKPIYGHMDYGKKDPSAWAGASPTPGCRWLAPPTSASPTASRWTSGASVPVRTAAIRWVPAVSRGGATNSPAAVYALTKYVDWMKKYAPKEATGMTFGESGPVPAQGQIAQQIFWYTAFTADMTKPGLPVVNADGTPKWRMAPGPNGPYWKQGMQNGYQDVGSWTFFEGTRCQQDGRGVAVRTVRDGQDHIAEEDHRGPDPDPRERHPEQGDDRHGAQAGWPGGVLSQPGARGLDAHRYQRARLPEAGAAVVEERGRGGDG
jgi:ABC-type glycerol-3-phosphate transport system substrate-binding protein